MTANVSNHDKVRRSLEGPAWRWRRALELAESRSSGVHRHLDDDVRNAAGFVRMMNSGVDSIPKARRNYPIIAQAKALWDTDHSWQQFVIMVLGEFTPDAMSEKLNAKTEVVEIAERLFFDVRESRQAIAWINIHVIMPEIEAGNFELAVKYRRAYWGGAKVATWILETGKTISGDSDEHLAEQQQQLQMKCLAALEMPLSNSREAIQFLRISFEFQHKMKRLELEQEKFRTRAEQELRKHELAERRRRDAERRFEQELQTAQQRKERRRKVKNDRHRLASIQASLDKQRQYSEYQKGIERANSSPLAALLWAHTTNACAVTRVASAPQEDNQNVAA